MVERKITRCTIYTRKSSDEGLEQDFNSLDAQREACAAYIASQKHEGWVELPDRYDDGGFSGGTMERPGLKQLLADVRAKRIDVIVVYKVDRLKRSSAPSIALKPGTRLVREWHGVTHTVLIHTDGVEWSGQRYSSLSVVAREITGARWSGPRFFGLNAREPSADKDTHADA
jgi:Protein of unknown function (DUF2924)/Resolvase, N terminal domain